MPCLEGNVEGGVYNKGHNLIRKRGGGPGAVREGSSTEVTFSLKPEGVGDGQARSEGNRAKGEACTEILRQGGV